MKAKLLLLIILISLAASHKAFASPLDKAFERMNNFNEQDWSFQMISRGEEDTVEVFNPLAKPEWSLISINGNHPSKKQIKAYYREIDEAEAEDDDGNLNLHEMIDVSSLRLLKDDGKVAKYSFTPILDDDDVDFTDKLEGELWHNKQKDFIERFDFFSKAPFSPMAGVKISNMQTSIRFQEISKDIFVPKEIFSEVSGRAFIVKKVDEKESQIYTNYQQVNKSNSRQ
ncbi:MAG: hypothetical protein JKX81_07590 [Arenicella sp.]|nr:hypothetical protein [Arenicella sp.]